MLKWVNKKNGLIHTESSNVLPEIPHPAHPHGWRGDRHGRHTWSHCTSLLPASLHNHCRRGQCRLHRHADFGWRWWSPTITEGWTRPQGHRAVRALQILQNCQLISVFVNLDCQFSLQSHSYCCASDAHGHYIFLCNVPLLVIEKSRRLLLASPVLQMGIMNWRSSRNFFKTRMYSKCSFMQSATFQLHKYTDYMSRILNRHISQMCCHIIVQFLVSS